MIVIENIFISDDIITEQFVCKLSACKGVCCIEGEGGAPLEHHEEAILSEIYPQVQPYLSEAGIKAIAEQGYYTREPSGKAVTPLINHGACAYVTMSEGIALCGIERAYHDGKTNFPKPISCHLYPIRIDKVGDSDAINYYYWDICAPACKEGKKQKIPVYQFLKEPIIRKYGKDFYDQLDATAQYILNKKNKTNKKNE